MLRWFILLETKTRPREGQINGHKYISLRLEEQIQTRILSAPFISPLCCVAALRRMNQISCGPNTTRSRSAFYQWFKRVKNSLYENLHVYALTCDFLCNVCWFNAIIWACFISCKRKKPYTHLKSQNNKIEENRGESKHWKREAASCKCQISLGLYSLKLAWFTSSASHKE